jgi:hypothetical protein
MRDTVFYSWQSDLPDNRGVIEKALNQAVRERSQLALRVEPVVDRALMGTAGAVRIDHDILTRIDVSAAFVGDVTLVTAPDQPGRRSPNPNVLIELGYALKGLGWQRIILPFNGHYGSKEDLPFDLEKNRLLQFRLSPEDNAVTRQAVHCELVADFKRALEAISRIPALKDDIAKFLDEVNPEIRRRIRAGRTRLCVNVSSHRLDKLQTLLAGPAAKELVEYAPTGRTVLGAVPGSATDEEINDVIGASVVCFVFVFRGDPATW